MPRSQHCTIVPPGKKMGQMINGGGAAENKLAPSFLGDRMRNKGTFKNVVDASMKRAHSLHFSDVLLDQDK